MQACPYDALYLDHDTHTAAKCNYCAHRVDVGLEPACVNVCPTHAIISGDMNDPDTEISQLLAREEVTVRKAAKGTEPRLFYIEADEASLQPTSTEPSTDYMSSSQASGVGHYARYAQNRMSQADPEQMLIQLTEVLDGKQLSREQVASDGLVPKVGDQKKLRQKVRDVIKENTQRVYDTPAKGIAWGWEVSAYVWTKSIAAGAFIVPFAALSVLGLPVPGSIQWLGVIISLVFLAVTGVLLVKDLGRPGRFLYVLLRPQWTSWLVKGAYCLALYGLFLSLWVAVELLDIRFLWIALPFLGMALAGLTAVYTAFLFAQAKGRDFWQSPILALHMLNHAIMAGASVFCLASLAMEEGVLWMATVRMTLLVAILLNVLTMTLELSTLHSTDDAQKTVGLIVRGPLSQRFWIGAVFIGNLTPLCLAGWGGAFPLAVAGIVTLIGLYITEDIWIRAPQMIPLS